MEIERFLPLIILWIIWRILSRAKPKPAKPKKTAAKLVRIPKFDRLKKPVPIMPTMEKVSIKDEEVELLPDEVLEPVDKIPTAPVKPTVSRKSGPKITSYSPNFLKKAIVWSEILGPPVGLREE